MANKASGITMRIIHRYLGFFLAGVMAMYAISGIVLIFRKSDVLKKEIPMTQTIAPNVASADLGKALKIRNLKVERETDQILYFKDGSYDSQTGVANYTVRELPFVLDKLTHLHKATHKDPLYFLNIFFGLSLLFFVISSFWMFMPSSSIFKKGIYFSIAGILLVLIMLFV